ncbi:hypothetical protein ACSSS7_000256 [Eimeria intestinalis]
MESYQLGFAGKPSNQQAEGLARKRQSVCGFVPSPDAAGVPTGRITELTLHTSKKTDWPRRDGCSIPYITEPVGAAAGPSPPHKKSQLRYCGVGPEEQRQHFQTRWKPVDGKMEFCTGRRRGSATVECDYDCIDRDTTYHTWKRMNEPQKNSASHLQVCGRRFIGTAAALSQHRKAAKATCKHVVELAALPLTASKICMLAVPLSLVQFDRFLTVVEEADRSDRLPDVKNRNPPVPNKDGPFEKPRPRGGNLDRTCVPREDAKRRDNFAVYSKRPTGLDSSHLQLSTLYNRTGADRGEMRHGLKRNPQPDHAFDFVLPSDRSVPAASRP